MSRSCDCNPQFESVASKIPSLSICGLQNDSHGFLLEFAAALPVIILLQLALLAHSVIHEMKQRLQSKSHAQSHRLRILYLFLQIVGLLWTIIDVINYGQLIINNEIICNIAAFLPKFIPSLFYGLYFSQILLRLKCSFHGSRLALRTATFIMLCILIAVPCLMFAGVLVYLYWDYSGCHAPWNPPDFVNVQISFCTLPLTAEIVLLLFIGIIWAVLTNMVLSIMFGIKLRSIMSRENGHESQIALEALCVKNTILSVAGSVSTVSCYLLWIGCQMNVSKFGSGAIFLYLDLLFNCICIGLMFKQSEKHYERCCGCCIRFCVRRSASGRKRNSNVSADVVQEDRNYVSMYTPNSNLTASPMEMKEVRSVSPSASPGDCEVVNVSPGNR